MRDTIYFMETEKICPNCAAPREFKQVMRDETYSVRGKSITIPGVRVEVCTVCGESLFDEHRDQALLEGAYAEYRQRRN